MKEDEWKAIAFYSSFFRAIYWKIIQKAKISALGDVNLTEKRIIAFFIYCLYLSSAKSIIYISHCLRKRDT